MVDRASLITICQPPSARIKRGMGCFCSVDCGIEIGPLVVGNLEALSEAQSIPLHLRKRSIRLGSGHIGEGAAPACEKPTELPTWAKEKGGIYFQRGRWKMVVAGPSFHFNMRETQTG